ncbi:MAG: protein-L-isoaspartate(D-aspartate) O-methyltransferase [Candidatus Bathyarchaeia archaeon]
MIKASIIIGIVVIGSVVVYAYFMGRRGRDEFEKARSSMVETQLRGRGISDRWVLEVMGRVPRHEFVDPSIRERAYNDSPLPIAEGQTISQPYVVALMTESLKLEGTEKVLEIGTGSGYQAAVLAEICDEVYTIEIREGLAKSADERLKNLGYDNVQVKWADGYFGWEEHAPFDAIIITCAVNHVPPYLLQQLEDGGRLILPLGSTAYYQTLTLVEKKGEELTVTHITSVVFVPMIGEAQKSGGG